MVTARRNVIVFAWTCAALGGLFTLPTSLNRGGPVRLPGTALAPVGIVALPSVSAAQGAVPGGKPGGKLGAPGHAKPLAAAPKPAVPAAVTVNGSSVDTQYGPVQVQIVIQAGRVVTAHAIDYPHGGDQSDSINAQAVPVLNREAVGVSAARIDTVSGATFTSQGYRESLQSALDAAHRVG